VGAILVDFLGSAAMCVPKISTRQFLNSKKVENPRVALW